ncbi:MAG: benzoate-CoA ligase family protein [Firmicutes bacterium]|nr:benzoate-CoA ligase family protein [Bacillota bacterium]
MITKIEVPQSFNVASALIDPNLEAGRGDKVAIYYLEQQITYAKMAEMVNRTGNVFKNLGVEMENRVLLLLFDCPEFFYGFYGAIKMGAVAIPVNTMLTPADYEYVFNDSRAKVLVVSAELLSQVEQIKGNLKYLKEIIVVGANKAGYHNFDDLAAAASPDLATAETSKDDAAYWLYSSGSTGAPKGTVHLHHDIFYCTFARNILNIGPDDITFSVGKLFFAYGLGNASYSPIQVGASTVLYPGRPLAEELFKVVQKYRPTLFFGVPTAYNNMLQIKDAEKIYDFSSVRLCTSSGEALPATLYHQWKERFNIEILDVLGSTEMGHTYIANRPGQVRPGSSGLIVPPYEAKAVDEAGQEVPRGEIGTLLVKGDSAAAYYWNKHEKTKQTILGEWVNTGDKCYQDEDGYWWPVGRNDDMLKVGGIWVSPLEVESALMEHPAVLESAVVGAADPEGLIKPLAFVALKVGYQPSDSLAQELQQYVKSKIAPYKYPRWVKFVDELPKTASGKIQRYRLRNSN